MASVVISQEAMDYIHQKKIVRPNVVVYRDASGIILGYTSSELKLVPKVKVTKEEPNELFTVVDNSYGVPVWVERGLLPRLAMSNSVVIAMKKRGLRRALELQMDAEPGRP